jgi:hypothetical protein
MMHEFIYWPKLYLLLSATCDETLSWMIEMQMKNHLVSDSNCNVVNLQSPKRLQGMTNHIAFTFSVCDTTQWFTIRIEQDNQ